MLTKNRADADDLYQDAFLQGYKLLHKIDMCNNPSSFIITIAVRLWKSKQRKAVRRMNILPQAEMPEFDIADSALDVAEQVTEKEAVYLIRKYTDELPEKMRLAVLMFYSGGMTIGEIAKEMRVPEGTIKSRLNTARRKLKEKLEECGYESY
jgi:RNA polymerase sigma-70 factor (ECF subfamily)